MLMIVCIVACRNTFTSISLRQSNPSNARPRMVLRRKALIWPSTAMYYLLLEYKIRRPICCCSAKNDDVFWFQNTYLCDSTRPRIPKLDQKQLA